MTNKDIYQVKTFLFDPIKIKEEEMDQVINNFLKRKDIKVDMDNTIFGEMGDMIIINIVYKIKEVDA